MRVAQWTLTALLVACAPDLRPTARPDAGADDGATDAGAAAFVSGRAQTRTVANGVLESTINAEDSRAWVYVDLDRLAMAAETMEGWDVAFNRFKAMTNGGVHGTGGVEVAVLDDVSFEDARQSSSVTWVRDMEDGPDANTDPDYALSAQADGWFVYDSENHTLSPKRRSYLLRTTEGRVLRWQWLGYYDAAGSPGFPRVRWGLAP
jgi:hypothetical protein